MKTAAIVPTLHMNGSGIANLRRELESAHTAGRAFLNALAEMTPNARDYYVNPGTWESAIDAHQARMQSVRQVMDEILAIWHGIEDQQ